MATCTQSTEDFQVTFDSTSGETSQVVNLTKGQDYTQCAAWYTFHATGTGTDDRANNYVGLELFDNSGTAAVRIRRNAVSTTQPITVRVFVWEVKPPMSVIQGTIDLTGMTVTATTTDRSGGQSIPFFSQYRQPGSSSTDNWNDTLIKAEFLSTTQLQFSRKAAGNPDWRLYYNIVFDPTGASLFVQHINHTWSAGSSSASVTIPVSIDPTKTFIVPGYQSGGSDDDMHEAISNHAITGPTTLSWYRNSGASLNASGEADVYVVEAVDDEFSAQRFEVSLPAATTIDVTVSQVDLSSSAVVSSHNIGGGAWSVDSTTNGANCNPRQSSLRFLTNTQIRVEKQSTDAPGGANSRLRMEAVEFNLGAAPVVGGAMYHHLQNLGAYA